MSILLYGASGHAKVILEILEEKGITVDGIFDDNNTLIELLGYRILGSYTDELAAGRPLILSIGNNAVRKKLNEKLNGPWATAIHPRAVISRRSRVGEGTVVMSGVSVNSEVQIGKHCIINTNCSIDHDCELGDYVHISPNAALAGNVKVGEGAHIGIGASVIQGIKIGRWAVIGAGSVVIRDVPDNTVVVGNPGRVIKQH